MRRSAVLSRRWIAALAVGFLTWGLATYVISISGADRELTEGFGSLFAALILLWVGIWMHGKSQAGEWQRYIRDKLSRALSRESMWGLFGLTFVVGCLFGPIRVLVLEPNIGLFPAALVEAPFMILAMAGVARWTQRQCGVTTDAGSSAVPVLERFARSRTD